jgi:SAM-dependent methyltransferase
MSQLAASDIDALDPYLLMGVLGKRYIHPGGRRSTEQLLSWADIGATERVLDVGCGAGTTAVQVAQRTGASVTAADISPLMRELATRTVHAAGVTKEVTVDAADIIDLHYAGDTFDCVIAEAVTMFVDRSRAARELVRVTRPGGRVLATEFYWRQPPSEEAREIFLGQVCPGLAFDSVEDWVRTYAEAGLSDIDTDTGPFAMLSPRGFLDDEGIRGVLAFGGRALTRWTYLRRLAWLMPRMAKAVPYLGFILVAGRKPETG